MLSNTSSNSFTNYQFVHAKIMNSLCPSLPTDRSHQHRVHFTHHSLIRSPLLTTLKQKQNNAFNTKHHSAWQMPKGSWLAYMHLPVINQSPTCTAVKAWVTHNVGLLKFGLKSPLQDIYCILWLSPRKNNFNIVDLNKMTVFMYSYNDAT